MKFQKVKALLKMTALVVIISLATSTTSTFAFAKQSSKNSNQITESFISTISSVIDGTNLKDSVELDSLQEKLVNSSNQYASDNELGSFQKVSIVRVVDGDTIVVDIEGDNCKNKLHERTVRLIGINTEESVASEEYLEKTGKQNTEKGIEASNYTKNFLTNFDYVYLQQDISDTDLYDRLLRYVWIEVPTDEYDLAEISTCMLNGALVSNGYADVATYYPDVQHEEDFEQLHEDYLDEYDN